MNGDRLMEEENVMTVCIVDYEPRCVRTLLKIHFIELINDGITGCSIFHCCDVETCLVAICGVDVCLVTGWVVM